MKPLVVIPRTALLCALFTHLVCAAHAATIVWTNTAGGSWHTAANWSPNQLPGSSDTAVITNNGTYRVLLGADALVAGLKLGSGSGTQTVLMTNFTLMKPGGQAEIAGGGVLRMEAGYLSGAIAITNGGQLVFAGDSTKYLYGTKLNNAGTILWTNAGSLLAAFNGDMDLEHVFITNSPGGTFEIAGDAVLDYAPSGWMLAFAFQNAGTLRKSGGTGMTILGARTASSGLVFENLGSIVVQQGSLVFTNGFANNGTFTLATNTNVRLDAGTFNFGPASLASGPGQLLISRDTAVSVTVTGTIPNLTWSNGLVRGSFTVPTNATLKITGDDTKYLYGTKLNNAGTILWSGTGSLLAVFNSEVDLRSVLITNLPGATFEIANDAILDYAPNGWQLAFVFHNAGTLRKSGATGATRFAARTAADALAFENVGNIIVEQGSLVFTNGFTNNGTFNLATNTTVRLDAGTFRFGPASQASGQGQLLICTNAYPVILSGMAPSLTWSGGWVRGTFMVATNATLRISGDSTKYLYGAKINNAGTILWTGAGNVTAYFEGVDDLRDVLITNLHGATFEIANDAALDHIPSGWAVSFVFHNAGTLRKTAGTGTTAIGDDNPQVPLAFQNTGSIVVEQGTLSLSHTENTGSIVAQSAIAFRAGFTNDGVLNLSSNVVINLSGGSFTFGPDSQVLGAGLFQIPSGNVVLNGTLSRLDWTGGTLLNSSVTIPSNGLFTISGGAIKTIKNSAINNSGTILWSGSGDLWAVSTGTSNSVPITNFAGGVFDIQTDAGVYYDSSGGFHFPFLLHNAGTFRKSAGTGTNGFDSHLEYTGTGLVDVQTGALSFGGTFVQSGGTLNFGLTSPTIYGKLIVPSQASVRGIIRATLNSPSGLSAGDQFPVLNQGSSVAGAVVFAGRNLGSGFVYDPALSASALTLVLRAATHPTRPVLSLSYAPQMPAYVLLEGTSNLVYRIQASSTLTDWTTLVTNTAPEGVLECADADAPTFARRFYRAITP